MLLAIEVRFTDAVLSPDARYIFVISCASYQGICQKYLPANIIKCNLRKRRERMVSITGDAKWQACQVLDAEASIVAQECPV